jgi:hypothetical protein
MRSSVVTSPRVKAFIPRVPEQQCKLLKSGSGVFGICKQKNTWYENTQYSQPEKHVWIRIPVGVVDVDCSNWYPNPNLFIGLNMLSGPRSKDLDKHSLIGTLLALLGSCQHSTHAAARLSCAVLLLLLLLLQGAEGAAAAADSTHRAEAPRSIRQHDAQRSSWGKVAGLVLLLRVCCCAHCAAGCSLGQAVVACGWLLFKGAALLQQLLQLQQEQHAAAMPWQVQESLGSGGRSSSSSRWHALSRWR